MPWWKSVILRPPFHWNGYLLESFKISAPPLSVRWATALQRFSSENFRTILIFHKVSTKAALNRPVQRYRSCKSLFNTNTKVDSPSWVSGSCPSMHTVCCIGVASLSLSPQRLVRRVGALEGQQEKLQQWRQAVDAAIACRERGQAVLRQKITALEEEGRLLQNGHAQITEACALLPPLNRNPCIIV